MKKLVILQIKGYELGGVWYFNKTISEELLKHDFEIEIISIRNNKIEIKDFSCNKKIKLKTINEVDKWEITRKKDILKEIKSFNIKNIIKTTNLYFKEHKKLNLDYKKLKNYLKEIKPDYIIASHYQTLDGIPNEFLKRTIAIQHSSLEDVLKLKDNTKKLRKYSKKIYKMVWLSKKTKELAEVNGFSNNTYIYNPIRFKTEKQEQADVINNKKLIVVTRIENEQKRIDLMLEIVNDVLKEVKDWTFEIYGLGEFTEYGKNILNNNNRIKYMGKTNNPMEVLLNASINLNTSNMEGFSLSILEANMCSLPTIAFDFGESVNEQIIDNKTGYIIYEDNIDEYKEKLISLMTDQNKLLEFSKNSKEFSKNFTIDKVILNWLNLFKNLDKEQEEKN